MSGFPGSGKSTVSKYIAKLTGAVIVDHDVLKSALLQSLEMKGIESAVVGGVSYDVEWALIDSYLDQGHSVILDSPCLSHLTAVRPHLKIQRKQKLVGINCPLWFN